MKCTHIMVRIELYITEDVNRKIIKFQRDINRNRIRRWSSYKGDRETILEGMKFLKTYIQMSIDDGESCEEIHRKVWKEDPFGQWLRARQLYDK